MKRIAHYAPNIWAKGGIATYVRRLGQAQSAAGFEVTYFSRNPEDAVERKDTIVISDDRELFRKTKEMHCDVLHLHKPVSYLPADRVTTVRTMHGNQGSCPTGTRFLARSTRPCKRRYSPAGCLISHFTERCGSLKPAKLQRNFGGIKNELKLGEQIQTFTVSHFLKGWMMRTGFAEERLHVIKSPAPDYGDEFLNPPADGIPRFVFIGRLVPEKGAQWLLESLTRVQCEVAVDIAGDGPMHAELEAFCNKKGLQDRVTFHGWVNEARVSKLMEDARAIVFPSIWEEPAGLITLETAASGRPVIASRAGGIPEYALDEFSLLVAPNDSEQLAGAIDRLAKDHELASRMGVCALRSAKDRYSLSRFLEKQMSLYRMALETPELELIETQRN